MSTHFDLNNSCSSTNFPPSAAGPNSSFFIIIEYCITFEWKWNVPKEPSVCSSIQHGIILCFCKFLLSQSGLGSCRADTKTPKFGFQFHQMPIRAFFPSLSLSLSLSSMIAVFFILLIPLICREKVRKMREREQFHFFGFFLRSRPEGVVDGFCKGSILGRLKIMRRALVYRKTIDKRGL